MNLNIKKETIVELINKTIENNVTKCKYYLSNEILDKVLVLRNNKNVDLKLVSNTIYLQDYNKDTNFFKLDFHPMDNLFIELNKKLFISILPVINSYTSKKTIKEFKVKYLGIPIKRTYDIITKVPVLDYYIFINDEYNTQQGKIKYQITSTEYFDFLEKYRMYRTEFNKNSELNKEKEILINLNNNLIEELKNNKIEINLE